MSNLPTGYESPSWWYDIRGFFILKLAYRGSLLQQIGFFSNNIGSKHLEAAIGSGTLFDLIVKWRKLRGNNINDVTAFDYAETMLAGARRRFRTNRNVKLLSANVHKLPFKEETFESINVANAIHCFADLEGALSEMHRVLKAGGLLATNVLLVPSGFGWQRAIASRINKWGAKKGILHKAYEAEEFKHIAEKVGFRISSEFKRGNGLFVVLQKAVSPVGALDHAAPRAQ